MARVNWRHETVRGGLVLVLLGRIFEAGEAEEH